MIDWMLSRPSILPALDPDFKPPVLAHRTYLQAVKDAGGGVPLVLGLERGDGSLSRFETRVFEESDPRTEASKFYVERLVKFLLWQRGGWRVYVGGPKSIGEHIQQCYQAGGSRAFDFEFMGVSIYDKAFTVVICDADEVPAQKENASALGRHLEGYRIGFDLGGSDRKVSAVVNGEAIYSEEVMWNPIQTADPAYHYNEVMTAIKTAASKMPRLDAIGGSAAGVYVDNRARIASLFRAVPKERYHEVHDLFPRISREMGVPLVMVNDGEVTALAGSMSLEDNGVLGIAMGTSEAGGYVNLDGNITGWLNELAFCPVDYNPTAPVDEWSKDYGVGALYFSQQCAFRLAPKVGISLPDNILNAEKLKIIQDKMEAGEEGALKIWQSMGVYLGYTLAHYADFYDIRHALILGRVTSGKGGDLLLSGAQEVLEKEFPALAKSMCVQLPDEKSRRVGQSIAAASLPDISK
ncbi:MAG TPA: ROK family protein [Candidatus Hydrogenedentes bacterium]|jgi:predicted NBD/HSP70 family sugar kinase|nr:ROK family protein [Candidatus Hydrogenedentota bacterium]HQB03942.1 ROK family protein [Candidatus Hydrogenedentota bacterium]